MVWGGVRALLLAAFGLLSLTAASANGERRPQAQEDTAQQSVLVIPARADFPLSRRISMGANESVLVQFPFELRDVLVSSPDIVDAVVQSSNRVFLIGKKIGQANAFFFDAKGQQLLTLEINVGADLKGLDGLLMRYVPGSRIQVEMAGNAAVLSGSVRTPIDSKRAEDIACQMVAANGAVAASVSPNVPGFSRTATVAGSSNTGFAGQAQTQSQVASTAATACSGATKLVINLLSVEGEDQVMLKVTVAEVQRTVLKQFGINIGALVNSSHFTTAILSQNALPLTSAAGLGSLAVPNVISGALDVTTRTSIPGFTNSGASSIFNDGTTQLAGVLRAMERDGLIRTLAEPNLTAVSGETANFLAGGEYPIPVVDSDGKLSVTFKKFGVALAFTPEDRQRSERAHQRRCRCPLQHFDPGTEEARSQVHRRTSLRRFAGHRRADLRIHAAEHGWLPRIEGRSDPRHLVPQPRLSKERDRARRHRYPLYGAPNRAPEPGAPGRRIGAATDRKASGIRIWPTTASTCPIRTLAVHSSTTWPCRLPTRPISSDHAPWIRPTPNGAA
jgi:pilus assembly protein CpaC